MSNNDRAVVPGPNGTQSPVLNGPRIYVAAHPKSAITHELRRIFAEARQGQVLLQERGGDNFVLVAESLLDKVWDGVTEIAKVLALTQTSPENFPELPDYAWTVTLSIEAREQLRRDLVLALRQTLEKGNWDAYEDELYSWQITAEVRGDPELSAELLADWDPNEEVPLRRP